MNYDFNILYYINIYKKWYKKIIFTIVISMFLTVCVSFFLPVTYISSATVLMPDKGSASDSLGKFLGIPGFSMSSSSEEVILAILRSGRMKNDIKKHFDLDNKPKFKYSISDRRVAGGLAIDVKGTDPALIQKIANFAIDNLDKINTELDITPNKPMVKMLDPATHGSRQSRQTARKMFVAGLAAFLAVSLYAFFSDYIKKLRSP